MRLADTAVEALTSAQSFTGALPERDLRIFTEVLTDAYAHQAVALHFGARVGAPLAVPDVLKVLHMCALRRPTA